MTRIASSVFGHRDRRLAEDPPGRIAAPDAEVHPAAGDLVEGRRASEAVTVGSRVPGLVTQVPRRIRSVAPAISVSSG